MIYQQRLLIERDSAFLQPSAQLRLIHATGLPRNDIRDQISPGQRQKVLLLSIIYLRRYNQFSPCGIRLVLPSRFDDVQDLTAELDGAVARVVV